MKLWRLMESECHELDLELARLSRGQSGDRQGYLQYCTKIHQIVDLEEESEKGADYVARLDSACTVLALRLGEAAQQTPLLQDLRAEAVRAHNHVQSVVCRNIHVQVSSASVCIYTYTQKRNIQRLREECKEGFDIEDGPFCRALDMALEKFKVHRQAYYGGTFTGNHSHKCLKV